MARRPTPRLHPGPVHGSQAGRGPSRSFLPRRRPAGGSRASRGASASAIAGLLLVVGCSVERGEGRFSDQATVALDAGLDGGPLPGDASLGEELKHPAGTWLLFLENATCLEALGQSREQIIWTWYRAELADLGPGGATGERRLRVALEFCRQEVSPALAGLRTYVPDRVGEHLPEFSLDAILLGASPGDRFLTTELLETWGMRGVSADEPLPTEAGDQRVFDQDDDGHPGVTLVLGDDLCEICIVQRTRSRLTGAVVNAGRVEGSFWNDLDKVVLEATQALCSTENQVVPSGNANRFVLIRVDGEGGAYDFDLNRDGDIACGEVLEARRFFQESGEAAIRDPDDTACR